MATTTNFGWETPDDTDLVKDGALAMRTLGNSIDSSFADLRGGTTGQVLAKSSNTDLDYTWVTQDDANAIQNAIVDAKGDLIAASAADTPARLAVGANGETLVADSSTATGLRWQGSQVAGRNFLINGNFDIWQRGTSFNTLSTGLYAADRWQSGAPFGNYTFTQQTTGVPSTARFCLRATATSAGVLMPIQQLMETQNAELLWGQTVTFSVKVRRNSTFANDIVLTVARSATVDAGVGATWTNIGTTTIANASLPTGTTSADWLTAVLTVAIPADGTANSLRIRVDHSTTVANGGYYEISQNQLEIGSVATAFTRATGTLAGELAACQRYYQRIRGDEGNGGTTNPIGLGSYFNASIYRVPVRFPVKMRRIPDYSSSNTTNYFQIVGNGATFGYATTTLDIASPDAAMINVAVSGATTGTSAWLQTANASSFIDFSAEL